MESVQMQFLLFYIGEFIKLINSFTIFEELS